VGRAALETAAAVGVVVELELLAELRCDDGLGEVLERGLLREIEPGIAAFRHDLVREAFHAGTHWPRRRSLHRELATVLEARGAEPRLTADHWLAAGERRRALPLLVEAARRSCEVHAYRDAAACGRVALEIWPEGEDEPKRLQVLQELGHCAQLCGELGEASRVWEEVAAGLDGGDTERLADVKQRLAIVYELEGASPRAAATRLEAANAFEAVGRHAEAAGELLLAAEGLWHDEAAATRALDRALEAARRADDSEWAAVTAYWALGATANDWGDYAGARSVFDDMLVYCQANELEQDEQFCLGCLVVVLGNAGEWTRAEPLARDLLHRAALPEVSRAHPLLTLG
jgi:tetratricopeptide (TPR) repeat protein